MLAQSSGGVSQGLSSENHFLNILLDATNDVTLSYAAALTSCSSALL
jgi:hypothetical protein